MFQLLDSPLRKLQLDSQERNNSFSANKINKALVSTGAFNFSFLINDDDNDVRSGGYFLTLLIAQDNVALLAVQAL